MRFSCVFLWCCKNCKTKTLINVYIKCAFGGTLGLWSILKWGWRGKSIAMGVPSSRFKCSFFLAGFLTGKKEQKKRILFHCVIIDYLLVSFPEVNWMEEIILFLKFQIAILAAVAERRPLFSSLQQPCFVLLLHCWGGILVTEAWA